MSKRIGAAALAMFALGCAAEPPPVVERDASTGADGAAARDAAPPDTRADGDGGPSAPPYERPDPIEVPALPPEPDYSEYPRDADGRPILTTGRRMYLRPRTPDPIWALARCTRLVLLCFDPDVRTLDECMISVPTCTSTEPWNEPTPCCAADCFDAYEASRLASAQPLDSFFEVFHGSPSCMPGVDAALRGP